MNITTVLFDLDGTLLPLKQNEFSESYFTSTAEYFSSFGYDPEQLSSAVHAGMVAMVRNDGTVKNEKRFWDVFDDTFGDKAEEAKHIFERYYTEGFEKCRSACGFSPRSAEIVRMLRAAGKRVILATNAVFSIEAIAIRLGWAGLTPEDFDWITVYDNSTYCKPNPDYYREILGRFGVLPGEGIMVGNDVDEDMVAATIGMNVFLLTDCMLNRHDKDISVYPRGSYDELAEYLKKMI